MSRLSLLASLAALALLGGGASGLALSREAPSPTEPTRAGTSTAAPTLAIENKATPGGRLLRLGESELLATALLRAGVGGLDASLADKIAVDLAFRPDKPARLWLGSALPGGARQLDRLEVRGSGNKAFALTRTGEGFTVQHLTLDVDDTPVRLQLETGVSLATALSAAGLPDDVRRELLARANGTGGARMDVIIEHEESSGQSLYGTLLYVALSEPSGHVRRWLAGHDGELRPLVAAAEDQEGLDRPVPGPVTSNMGLRLHPILRFFRWHRGTDFAAPLGSPVRAAASGRVVEAGWRGGYGRVVRLAHDDGSITAYAHLHRIDAQPGEVIPSGAVIGLVGASGLATGPHLHFEWLKNGRPLQPTFARARSDKPRPLDAATLASLRAILAAPYRAPPAPSRGLARAQTAETKALKSPA